MKQKLSLPIRLKHAVNSLIPCRVAHTGFGEAFFTQDARIALAASVAAFVGVVATQRVGVIDSEADPIANNLGFRFV